LPTRLDPKTSIIGKLIEFAYNRYVNVWYKYRKFLLSVSIISLFLSLLVMKLGFLIILNNG
jgi:hypothetical protein